MLRPGFVFRKKYFSAMHRLHLAVTADNDCALSIISYDKCYSVFDSFSFHTKSLKVVAVFVVKSKARYMLIVLIFLVFLTYFLLCLCKCPVFFEGFCSTVAWYTTPFWRHWPLSRHDFLSLQLQVFSFIFVDSRTVLLWLEIICFIFCMQL